MLKILFVCLGNICRSPAAEAIMTKLVADAGLSDKIQCDSAATSAYHDGNLADERMREHAEKRGYHITSRSRPFTELDLEEFDYIIPMDQNNYCNIKDKVYDESQLKKIFMMCSYCNTISCTEVPDPYIGGSKGFEFVLDILEDACQGLLIKLQLKLGVEKG